MNILNTFSLAAALAIFVAPLAQANNAHHAASAAATSAASVPAQSTETALTEGEVKKVNKDTGKLTIKHGELKNLGMPPMTMVFRAKDPAMLDQVKAGDKINFVADKVEGQFTVTKLEIRQ
ncbi:copper-binding protein [Noviherbaspirillum sedimenti]|uniref:RND transporter n=1 Tax=Noviherbaspirillum sedimenti TaxID=2320865 RepID=A0A3A3GRB7_9BURK|nr:copper-binding protein [Noviherbaspirillum sedimenti]RJG03500.1 RND transporter [Noviherbaspirillum sedimenti]